MANEGREREILIKSIFIVVASKMHKSLWIRCPHVLIKYFGLINERPLSDII